MPCVSLMHTCHFQAISVIQTSLPLIICFSFTLEVARKFHLATVVDSAKPFRIEEATRTLGKRLVIIKMFLSVSGRKSQMFPGECVPGINISEVHGSVSSSQRKNQKFLTFKFKSTIILGPSSNHRYTTPRIYRPLEEDFYNHVYVSNNLLPPSRNLPTCQQVRNARSSYDKFLPSFSIK